MSGFFILGLLGLGVWFWLSTLRVREQAIMIALHACQRHQMQLLDQSVALEALKIRRHANGHLTWLRIYGFDYSSQGYERQHGRVFMLGERLEQIQMDTPEGMVIDLAAERQKREQALIEKTQTSDKIG